MGKSLSGTKKFQFNHSTKEFEEVEGIFVEVSYDKFGKPYVMPRFGTDESDEVMDAYWRFIKRIDKGQQ